MPYELWAMDSFNLLASCESEDQALGLIVDWASRDGAESIESIALVRAGPIVTGADGEEDADMEMIESGAALLARAVSDGEQ